MTADVLAFLRAAHEEIEDKICDRIAEVSEMGHNPFWNVGYPWEGVNSILARVRAEQAVLASYERWCGQISQPSAPRASSENYEGGYWDVAEDAVRWLAYGHRHTIPGYDPAWAPEGVSADA